jgi:hypothetical protein
MKFAHKAVIAVAAGVILAGCGNYDEANNHKAPSPFRDVHLQWERVESPSNYPSIVHTCFKGNGIYLNQDASNTTTVLAHDPTCHGQNWTAIP